MTSMKDALVKIAEQTHKGNADTNHIRKMIRRAAAKNPRR